MYQFKKATGFLRYILLSQSNRIFKMYFTSQSNPIYIEKVGANNDDYILWSVFLMHTENQLFNLKSFYEFCKIIATLSLE